MLEIKKYSKRDNNAFNRLINRLNKVKGELVNLKIGQLNKQKENKRICKKRERRECVCK